MDNQELQLLQLHFRAARDLLHFTHMQNHQSNWSWGPSGMQVCSAQDGFAWPVKVIPWQCEIL